MTCGVSGLGDHGEMTGGTMLGLPKGDDTHVVSTRGMTVGIIHGLPEGDDRGDDMWCPLWCLCTGRPQGR